MATKFKADEIVVAIESFVTSALPSGPFSVAAGARLRADHPVVKATPWAWTQDGTPSDEIGRLRARLIMAAEAAIPVVVPTARTDRRIRDADAVVSIRAAGIFVKGKSATDDDGSPLAVPPGTRLHRKARIVRDDPDGFVPVLPAGVDRENALLALARLEEIHEDGSRDVIYEGTLVPRDSPFVAVHPHMFVMPIPE